MHYISYIISAVVLIAAIYGIYLYIKKSNAQGARKNVSLDTVVVKKRNITELVSLCAKRINGFLAQDYTNQNLTVQELHNKNRAKASLRKAAKDSVYGDREAKVILMEYINNTITTDSELRVTEDNIDEFIPFDDENLLSPQDKFFILLQGYRKYEGRGCLSKMFKEFNWNGCSDITDEMVNEAYHKALDPDVCVAENITPGLTNMDYSEKVDYIVQLTYQKYKGFGVSDLLFDTDIDEIDSGVSGIPAGSFELTNKFVKNAKYAYDSVWVMLHGRNVHLSCVSFGSQEELERVCHNIYRYNAQKVFSKSAGYVVSSMRDGSRVVVTRPPFSDKWAFYVRKFDSASSVAPEDLIRGEGRDIPLILCKWSVKGQRNIAITGQQGTGKTTMLKGFIRWIEDLNIRTQELAFELNLAFAYPEKNISAFQETDTISAQEGLNVQKKTNGAVNIVGEVATAEQASHIIQTANVASLFAMFTHHAKTTASLVNMIALNLLQMGLYKEKRDAVEISAKTLNIDVHLEKTNGYRHIERVCEIVPIDEQEYPSETKMRLAEEKIRADYMDSHDGKEISQKELADLMPVYTDEMFHYDEREYFKRQTDRPLFHVNEMCKWNVVPGSDDPKAGYYTLEHMPSDEMMASIKSVLVDPAVKQEYLDDMRHIQEIDRQVRENHKNDAEKQHKEGADFE